MGHRILGVGLTGPSLTDLERHILRDSPPYGVVLFARNVVSAEQLLSLVEEVKSQSSQPPLVMIDQEGGRVDRLRAIFPGLPSAEGFDEGDNAEELVAWFGTIIGQTLRYFDIDVNLAPVVDLRKGEGTKGLERRCFGSTANRVVELAGRFMRGQHDAGVATCLKHFPGLGSGSGDPHYGASVVNLTDEELDSEGLVPYRWLGNEAQAIMIGHGIYPKIEEENLPASLSYRMATEILRGRLGFQGLSVSDDMEMYAVSDLGSYEEICRRALVAGNDVILLCSHVEKVPEVMLHLESLSRSDSIVSARFEEAMARAAMYRRHCAHLKEKTSIPSRSLKELIDEVAEFCDAYQASRRESGNEGGGGDPERRRTPRTAGTGKTGREEWT